MTEDVGIVNKLVTIMISGRFCVLLFVLINTFTLLRS